MRVGVTTQSVASVSCDVLVQVFAAARWRRELHPCLHSPRLARRLGFEAGVLSWLEPARARAPLALAACVSGPDAGGDGSAFLRGLGALVERAADQRRFRHLAIAPTEYDVCALVEGILLRAHGGTEFAPDEEWSSVDELTVCVQASVEGRVRAALADALRVTGAVNFARSWCDLPANVGTPQELGRRARLMAGEVGLRARLFGPAELSALGMNLVTAVGAGGTGQCRMLVLEYRGDAGDAGAPLVLVGKGVTQDTGGYNLKRSDRLHEMSYDKAGAAAVVGAMKGITELGLPLNVTAIVPLAENGVGRGAMMPGDIVISAAGTSVCIENTDAEGRLLLADALHFSKRLRPRLVVDIASLTSASAVALGEPYAALFTNDGDVQHRLCAAGARSGEELWPLPIHARHVAALTHNRAHLRNVGGSGGEACVAAAFLGHFVDYPWAHVDVAMKGLCAAESPEAAEGATGFGTRLLIEVARGLCEGQVSP